MLGVVDLYLLARWNEQKLSEPKRLTFDDMQNGHPPWTADGREVIFTPARSGGTLALWRIVDGFQGSAPIGIFW